MAAGNSLCGKRTFSIRVFSNRSSAVASHVLFAIALSAAWIAGGLSARASELVRATDVLRVEPWYGGHKGVTNDNNYSFFSAAGRDFMIVGLEYGPTDDVLARAATLLRAHPNKRVIVAAHCYMYYDHTRLGPGDEYSPHKSHASYNDGEQMWEKLVRHHPTIFMVAAAM